MWIKSYEFCKLIDFSKIHVFPYSDRNGTVASMMKDNIPGNIKKDRVFHEPRFFALSDEEEENHRNFLSEKIKNAIWLSDELASTDN